MTETALASPQIATFVQTLVTSSGLDVRFEILACNMPSAVQKTSSPITPAPVLPVPEPQVALESSTAAGPDPIQVALRDAAPLAPLLAIEFTGPDAPLLIQRNGELLLALEHLTIQLLRLAPDQHERVSFDAEGFKAARNLQLRQEADAAVESVRSTGAPYAFGPMTSRERRLLHLSLTFSGLPTASAGEGARRHVVLYPLGYDPVSTTPAPPTRRSASSPADRTHALRNAFRRR